MKKKVLLVSQDSKVILQIRQWLRELPEETAVQTFSSIQEFTKEYLADPLPAEASTQTESGEATAAAPIAVALTEAADEDSNSYIVREPARLLCIDTESLGNDPAAMKTLIKIRTDFLQSHFSTKDFPARVIVIGHEHSPLHPDDFARAGFDDLQIKPLDKDMFLQKAGMYLADEASTSGKYLFKQATSYVIEMAKESTIEEISEFGVVVKNPVALAPGVYAHIHSQIFGEKNDQAVWGRVYQSKKHPTEPDAYLCYCAFFGINSAQMHNLRKYVFGIKKALHWPPVKTQQSTFKGLICNIAVIDRDEQIRVDFKNTLENNFSNVKVHAFRSYSHFVTTLQSQGKEHPMLNVSPEPIPVFAIGQEYSFFISGENWDLMEMSPALGEGDRFCGLFDDQLRASPTKWLDCVDPDDRGEFDEMLMSIKGGSPSGMLLRLKDAEGFQYPLRVQGHLQKSGAEDSGKVLTLEWRALKNEDWVHEMEKRTKEGHTISTLDALFCSATGLNDVAAWYEGTFQLLQKAGVLKKDRLPVCLMEDEKNQFLRLEQLRIKNIQGFIYRPVDHKNIMAKAVQMVPGLIASTSEVDLRFVPTKVPVRLAKEIEMDEVSEYGLQVKSSVPFKTDVFLRFYSPLLDQSHQGILAKCVSCVPDQNDKKVFHCFFMFFGVSETFLKHVRNWIREDYVSKKEKEG